MPYHPHLPYSLKPPAPFSEKVETKPFLKLLDDDSGDWRTRAITVEELIAKRDNGKTYIVLVSSDIFLKAPDRHQALSEKYGIPDSFWSPICQKSNGFFGCEGHYDSDWKPDGHSTWSRFLVKQVLPDAQSRVLSFAWFQIAFFLKQSASTGSILLCFDPPSSMQDRLEATLSSKDTKLNPCNPYTLHCVVTEEILAVFDNAIMSIRDQIRNLELNRTYPSAPEPDYPRLHDLARHTIHSSEILHMAAYTVERMMDSHELFSQDRQSQKAQEVTSFKWTAQRLRFHHQLFKGLAMRSEANEKRLQNEINLAFNMVSQHDSRVGVRIGKAARGDSAAMRTIALLTMLFLPATFVSAIFSTCFFSFVPSSSDQTPLSLVSTKFWIYWATAGPLTIATVTFWLAWQYWYDQNSD